MSKGGRPRMREEDKTKPDDKITCEICGEKFRRNNRWHHNNTKLHKQAASYDKEIRTLFLKKNVNVPEDNEPINFNQFRKKNVVDNLQNKLEDHLIKKKYNEDLKKVYNRGHDDGLIKYSKKIRYVLEYIEDNNIEVDLRDMYDIIDPTLSADDILLILDNRATY